MRNYHDIWLIACILILTACSHSYNGQEEAESDPIPMMVLQMQKCSRLYTSEYHIHKIVTHKDQMALQGSVMRQDFNLTIPVGERRIAIPMDATLKAYVDFSGFSEKNVRRKGNKITIILPDPKLMMTSTKINHQEVKKYVPLTRGSFTDEELTNYEQQGRKQIIAEIPKMGIIENARRSAASTIIPMLRQMGFAEQDITVSFRKDLSLKGLKIEKM